MASDKVIHLEDSNFEEETKKLGELSNSLSLSISEQTISARLLNNRIRIKMNVCALRKSRLDMLPM